MIKEAFKLTPHPPFEKKGVKDVRNFLFVLYNFNPVNLIFYPLNPVVRFTFYVSRLTFYIFVSFCQRFVMVFFCSCKLL